MCGIFGYISGNRKQETGNKKLKNAAEIVFEGLKRLEYRGYDSWGIAVKSDKSQVTSDKLVIEKHIGKIGDSKIDSSLIPQYSSLAIGHTRWATHGGVTVANAHPHLDCTGKIAVVHNGIVENFGGIKKELKAKKHKFVSETDTEVIAHLIEEESTKGTKSTRGTKGIEEAVRRAFLRLSGLNAVVVMTDGQLVAAKTGSPLVLGIGKSEFFLSSDAAAILPYTKKVVFLRDNQMVIIENSNFQVLDVVSKKTLQAKIETLNWEKTETRLGKYHHFMIKEIYEQPKVLRNIADNYSQTIDNLCELVREARGIFLIGAGTAFHACLAGSYLFSKIAKLHVNTIVASEFNYLEDFLNKGSLIIALSQSGETIDVIEPLRRAKEKGAKVVAVVNNLGSTIWQMADTKILLGAGPEIAVASTKAYIAKLEILLLTAYGLVGKSDYGRKLLRQAVQEVERLLSAESKEIRKIAKVLARSEHIFIIGRGLSYQSALEAALKIKEVSYLHTEGLAGGELKHGSIALISQGTPCIVFAPSDETYEAIISNATEVKSRGAVIIGISPKRADIFDWWIQVKDLGEASIIPNIIPCQLLGYYLALTKGLDPDKPRNLAKSVTVK